MTRPNYIKPLRPSDTIIVQAEGCNGQTPERVMKKPREYERQNIDICVNHCQCPGKSCSGTPRQMEKCRMKYEMENGK